MGDSKVVLPTEIMSHGIVVSVCPVCDSPWDENDKHHPEFDGTPQHQYEVTEGWTPVEQRWRKADEHNPEGF